MVRAARLEARQIEARQNAHDLQGRETLGRRRRCQQGQIAVGQRKRGHLPRGGSRQILGTDLDALGAQAVDDAPCQISMVEFGRTPVRYRPEGCRNGGLSQMVPCA